MKIKIIIPMILIFLALSLILVACKEDNSPETVDIAIPDEKLEDNIIEDENHQDEDKNLMEDFKDMVENSPSPDGLIKFIDENIDKVTAIDADIMIEALERNLQGHREEYENRIFELDKDNELMEISGDKPEFERSKIDIIQNKELKDEVQLLYSNMYKLQNLEGNFYPVIDYAKLKTYKDHITEEWKDYLAIQSLDSEERPMSDGALNISFDELADRILKTEGYLNQYIDSQRQSEMLENYEYKINAYLKGLPSTSIMDVVTGEIKEEVLSSYQKTSNMENYMTSHMVYEYLEAIKANEYIIDENIFKKADGLIEEALRLLREYK